MSSDTTTIIFIILAGLILIALVVRWIVIGWQRRNRHQARLDRAFERASAVRMTGSGIQGALYHVYGESSRFDNSGHNK